MLHLYQMLLHSPPYEALQHVPIALQQGVTQAQLDALAAWPGGPLFGDTERAMLRLTDAMTRDISFAPEIMGAVRSVLSERGAEEVAATIAAYNMVPRCLEALQIHADDPR